MSPATTAPRYHHTAAIVPTAPSNGTFTYTTGSVGTTGCVSRFGSMLKGVADGVRGLREQRRANGRRTAAAKEANYEDGC